MQYQARNRLAGAEGNDPGRARSGASKLNRPLIEPRLGDGILGKCGIKTTICRFEIPAAPVAAGLRLRPPPLVDLFALEQVLLSVKAFGR